MIPFTGLQIANGQRYPCCLDRGAMVGDHPVAASQPQNGRDFFKKVLDYAPLVFQTDDGIVINML